MQLTEQYLQIAFEKTVGHLIHNGKSIRGGWFLTDDNLVFIKFSPIGGIIGLLLKQEKIIDLPYKSITDVQYTKYGLIKHAIRIETETDSFIMIVDHHETWFSLIEKNRTKEVF